MSVAAAVEPAVRAPAPSSGAPPGPEASGTPFKALLESNVARTASAEGQDPKRSRSTSSGDGAQPATRSARHDGHARADSGTDGRVDHREERRLHDDHPACEPGATSTPRGAADTTAKTTGGETEHRHGQLDGEHAGSAAPAPGGVSAKSPAAGGASAQPGVGDAGAAGAADASAAAGGAGDARIAGDGRSAGDGRGPATGGAAATQTAAAGVSATAAAGARALAGPTPQTASSVQTAAPSAPAAKASDPAGGRGRTDAVAAGFAARAQIAAGAEGSDSAGSGSSDRHADTPRDRATGAGTAAARGTRSMPGASVDLSAAAAARLGRQAATGANWVKQFQEAVTASRAGARDLGSTVATTTQARAGAAAVASSSSSSAPAQPAATSAAADTTAPRAAAASEPAPAANLGRYSVSLEHAAETVRMSVQAAAAGGVSLARIQLSPASLGGIRIQLQQTPEGLLARVVADHPAAAAVLSEAGGELRRALAGSGVTLISLDIGASGQQAERNSPRGPEAQQGKGSAGSTPAEDSDEALALDTTTTTTIALPNGALIDILA